MDKKIKTSISHELAGLVVAAIRRHIIYVKSKAMGLPEADNQQFSEIMKNIQALHEYATELEDKISIQ
jgi:hypothetical protein